jgi:hypothetical protein
MAIKTYQIKFTLTLTATTAPPSQWVGNTITNVLTAKESLVNIMYEPVGTYLYEVTIISVLDSKTPTTWIPQIFSGVLVEGESLASTESVIIPAAEVDAVNEAIVSKIIGLRLG